MSVYPPVHPFVQLDDITVRKFDEKADHIDDEKVALEYREEIDVSPSHLDRFKRRIHQIRDRYLIHIERDTAAFLPVPLAGLQLLAPPL